MCADGDSLGAVVAPARNKVIDPDSIKGFSIKVECIQPTPGSKRNIRIISGSRCYNNNG